MMAEEKKNSAAAGTDDTVDAVVDASIAVESDEVKTVTIEDKLKEAIENLKRVNAEAKARKLEQEKSLRRSEEEAASRAEEAEKKRAEEDALAKTIAEQKLAAFAYAENYRKKLQRERSRAAEEQRLLEKQEREARLREERERAIEEHLEGEKLEAQKRSDRASALLERVTKFAKVGNDGRLSVVEAPVAVKTDAPKAPVTAEVSYEDKVASEVDSYLGNGTSVYEQGDRLVLNIVDDQMTVQIGEQEEKHAGGVTYADAIREELELIRRQREELSELFNEHRRFLAGETKTETVEEKEEEQEVSEPAVEEPLDPIVIDDSSVTAVKQEGEKVDSKKSLVKYLRYSEKVLDNLFKQIKAAERAFTKNEDENESPARIAEMLMVIAKVLEIRCDNLSVCTRMNIAKYVKKYSIKLADAIDDYNENVIAYFDLTGQELTRVSAFIPKYISTGEEEAVIPALSYRETYVEIYVESDGTVSYGDNNITTTLIAPALTRRDLLGDGEVETAGAAKAYVKKTRKALAKLTAERARLDAQIKSNNKQQEKFLAEEKRANAKRKEAIAALDEKFGGNRDSQEYNKAFFKLRRKYDRAVIAAETRTAEATVERKNLKLLVETFALEREKLDCLCTALAKIRLVGTDKAVDAVKKEFIRQMLEYNSLADVISAAIDAPIAKISSSLADEVIRSGSEVLFPKMAYRRELIETVGEDTRIVGDRLKTSFVGDIGGEEEITLDTAPETEDAKKLGKLYEAEQFLVDTAREESEAVIGKKSLGKFLRSTGRSIRSLKATLRQTDKAIMKSVDEGNVIASLVENIRVRGRYIELLAIRLVTVSKIVRGRKLRRETEALYNEIGKYNLKAIDYYNITGEQITRISAFLPENLANGTAEIVLPAVSYKENYVEVYSKSNSTDSLGIEEVLEKRRPGAYSPIHAKNRRLTENAAVTVTPINPPFGADALKNIEDPTDLRSRRRNARIARKSRRKLKRALKRAKKNLVRIEKQNKGFDKKTAAAKRDYEKRMFAIESQTSDQERQGPDYNKKLQKANYKFTSKVSSIELKRAKANIDHRKLKFIVERFVIEREFFAIACVALSKLRHYGKPKVVAEAKNSLIKAMADYNKCADACSAVLGEPIAKISSSIADEIVRGALDSVRLPKIVCFKEIVETIGEKSRVVGEKYKYGAYGRNSATIMMGSPFVGSDVAMAPSMGVTSDGAPVIGAANPTDTYILPNMANMTAAATVMNPLMNPAVNPMASTVKANGGFIYEAPIGAAVPSNAAAAQATYTPASSPMMPPVYGFVPPVVTEEKTAEAGDAYEETPVNADIATISKYTLNALRAKSLVVETPKEYRCYRRISKRLARVIEKLINKVDALHGFADKTADQLREISISSDAKAYKKACKKLKALASRTDDQFVRSKINSIIAELDSMKKESSAAEMTEYAASEVEKEVCTKFDLDILSAIGKLVEIRCQDLYAAAKVNVRRYVRRTRDLLTDEITNYNDHVTDYNNHAKTTDASERLTHISTLVPEKIARKETGIFIPEILFNKKFEEEKLSVAGANDSAYTICIPTPEQLAAGATVSTVPNPRLKETENDRTVTETVSAPAGYTADELLKAYEELSPKKMLKESLKAQSAIDKMIKKLEADISKQKSETLKRRRKIYGATSRYERAVLRLAGKSISSAKYQRKLRIKSKNYGKRIIKIDKKYPLPELLESKRLVLECFALEQENLTVAAVALRAVSKARAGKFVAEAKRRFIEAVVKYNSAADRTANLISASVTHADEGWVDMVILDGKLPTLPKIVYKKDVVEAIGEKKKVIGQRPAKFSGMYTVVFGSNGVPVFGTPAAVSVAGSNISPVDSTSQVTVKAPAEAAMAVPSMTLPLQIAYPYGTNAPQMVVMPGFHVNGTPYYANGPMNMPEETPAPVEATPSIDKKGLKKLAAKTSKNVSEADKRLIKSIKAFNRAKDSDKPAKIVACLAISKEIIDELIGVMSAAVSVGDTKCANAFVPALKNEIGRYNSLCAEYTKLTGRQLNQISQTLIADILSGKAHSGVAGVEYSTPGTVYKPLGEQPTAAEAELYRINRERAVNGVINDAALEAKVAEQANKDLAVITKYMDFEISMLESTRDIENFRYGKETRPVRASKKQIAKTIEKLKRAHLEALECERRDNERYYTVVMSDPDTVKTKKKNANRAKLDSIRTRLIVLLNKRDEINSQLSAIYTGTERNLDGSSVNQAYRHVKNSAAESMMRKDAKLAKRVARVSATEGEKQRMYTLLNKRLDAASTMALCKYRLKHEKNTYRTRRMLKKDIKDCKMQIKLTSQDIKWMIKRFKNREKESGAGFYAGLIVILLIVIAVAAGFVWIFNQDLAQLISGFMGGK